MTVLRGTDDAQEETKKIPFTCDHEVISTEGN